MKKSRLIKIVAIGLTAASVFSYTAIADEMPGTVGIAGFDTVGEETDIPGVAGVGGMQVGGFETAADKPLEPSAFAAADLPEVFFKTLEVSGGTVPSSSSAADKLHQEEHASVIALEERLQKYGKLYKDVVFPDIEGDDAYINIRTKATTNSDVAGKLYAKAAAKVVETVDGEDGPWFKVKSGSVTGYVKAVHFITGKTAEEMAKNNGKMIAKINTESLRLRKEASVESEQIALLSADDKYPVVGKSGTFVKLRVDDDLEGYVLDEYVTLSVSYKRAISIEEERAEQARLERLAKEREEAERRAQRESQSHSSGSNNPGGGNNNPGSGGSSSSSTAKPGSSAGSVSDKRGSLCGFAESYVGAIPYIYGGNSLASGVDCSGFVQQVFKHYGIGLPRTSGDQGSSGRKISSSEMRPGDIIYYGGHVAIYIGNETVVHASNPETGIKYSKWNYRTPISIRNVIGD